jgi:hypothetical protein
MIGWDQRNAERLPGENHSDGVVFDPHPVELHQMLLADNGITHATGAELRNGEWLPNETLGPYRCTPRAG